MHKSNHFIGIFLVSLATLLLELSLTRVMSVSLWYHFTFLVISTALLGFGTAKTQIRIASVTPVLFKATLQWSLSWRILLTLVLLAPLGLLLGMPFPTGIKTVGKESAAFIPWAWGINGFFTVIGSVSALIRGMIFGFKVVILLAGCCYLLAMILLPRK